MTLYEAATKHRSAFLAGCSACKQYYKRVDAGEIKEGTNYQSIQLTGDKFNAYNWGWYETL